MSFDKARYEERKKMQICVDCGRPVDNPDKYVRCKACRDNRANPSRNFREKHRTPAPEHTLKEQAAKEKAKRQAMKEAAEKAIQAAKNERKAKKCTRCEWASFTGSSFVCAFPEGACMK